MARLDPAAQIIDAFGGVRATARLLSINPSAVSRWTIEKERRGTGGKIPVRHWPILISEAKFRGIKIHLKTLADII